MSFNPTQRPLAAAAYVIAAMALLGLTDNLVILVTDQAGLWQFHLLRALLGLPLIMLAAQITGRSLRPVRVFAVLARSVFVSLAMVLYFGALAFVTVTQSAAGLFTSPIWVLLISVIAFGQRVSGLNIAAVFAGFAGVLLVLQPDASALTPALALPMAAGVFYAFGAIATRRYCAQEGALTLLMGFFIAMVIWGALGCLALAIWQPPVPAGADGFLLRGWMPVTAELTGLIAIQALGAVIGVGLIFRAYLLAEASFIAVFEYALLIFGGFWGWVLWGQGQSAPAMVGITLIIASGAFLARAEHGNTSA